MKGDVILVEDHHRRAATAIVEALLPRIRAAGHRLALAVAGESGSGKSETAKAIAEALEARQVGSVVFQQDDYFVHPPKTNDAARRRNIGWVGTGEVRLDLLDAHLAAARSGATEVTKPLVIYDEDRVTEETVSLDGADVAIAEGTYTTLLEHTDLRIFIDRNRLETLESRRTRGREAIEPFLEKVLEIEHEIISKHRERADIVISRDFDVTFAR